MANPGPAVTISTNSTAVLAGKNTNPASNQPNQNQGYQGQNALRCLAVVQGLNLNALGDTIVPVINASRWAVKFVVLNNASISLTTAQAALRDAPNGGGTAIVAAAALTAMTGPTIVLEPTVASTISRTTANLYINVTTAQGAAATVDYYVFGYDLSPVVTP